MHMLRLRLSCFVQTQGATVAVSLSGDSIGPGVINTGVLRAPFGAVAVTFLN